MKRSPSALAPSLVRASRRANALIDAMLREMQLGLKEPERIATPEWECLFGTKQSMVMNLQKLVQALGSLPSKTPTPDSSMPADREVSLSAEEMKLLTQWLSDRDG